MNFSNNDIYMIGAVAQSFDYNTTLSLSQKMSFVEEVCGLIIVDNTYIPLLSEFAFHVGMIQYFTNIEITKFTLNGTSLDIDMIDHFILESGIIEKLKNKIDESLLNELLASVELNIIYKTGIHTDTLVDAVSDLIRSATTQLNLLGSQFTQGIDSTMLSNLSSLASNINGLDKTDIVTSLVNAIHPKTSDSRVK